jgi:integrase
MQRLKQKHVKHLNDVWLQGGLNVSTIKNRNSHLRWLCRKLGKTDVVSSNEQLGIGQRAYVNNHINKAIDINQVDFSNLNNQSVLVQIYLQRHLGLRREEAIKIKPYQADKGTHIELQPSWCKGGRGRIVPILTPEARYWLDEAKKLVENPKHSLIPTNKSYIQYRHHYDKQTRLAGVKGAHGLRHAYAQARYQELTGRDCPKCGGLTSKQLTPEQKALDREARLTISEALGHSRLQITVNYLGR